MEKHLIRIMGFSFVESPTTIAMGYPKLYFATMIAHWNVIRSTPKSCSHVWMEMDFLKDELDQTRIYGPRSFPTWNYSKQEACTAQGCASILIATYSKS